MRIPSRKKIAPSKNARVSEGLVQISAAQDPLAGLIKCKCCNGAIVRVNAKHYACAQRHCCDNKLLVPKQVVEAVLVKDLGEKFLGKVTEVDENCSIYVAHTTIQTLAFLNRGDKRRKRWAQ